MKRTKEWWARLTAQERSRLVYLESSEKHAGPLGAGGYLPDDCRECGSCSTPTAGFGGLCRYCLEELIALLRKADNEPEPPR